MSNKKYTAFEQAILTTILYSDIFDFPLTKNELWKFLISEKKIARDKFEKSLTALQKIISYKNNYYCLSGREAIIAKRIRNLSEVKKKMLLAKKVAEKLSSIPSVYFIGLTGGLAAGNASKDDDIDLVIITKENQLFISRLLVLITLEFLGVRRARNQKNTADTICVNLLFDESELSWFTNFQDVYTAREISQIIPLFERDDMYQQFLIANRWIHKFLPNFSKVLSVWQVGDDTTKINLINIAFFNSLIEFLTRFLQMSLMKQHHSIETITNHILAFHPNNYRLKILRRLRLKERQFGLLTKI